MKAIVAPTDFSDVSLNAVNYAADMAAGLHASLALLNVCSLPVPFGEMPIPGEMVQALFDEADRRINDLKEELVKRTNGKINIYTEVGSGSVLQQLQDYSAMIKPYAIVMGTHGAGALERFFFGSNTIAAMKQVDWPLIVVPPEAKYRSIKKIGLACDLKKVVETSPIQEIRELAGHFNASLHVLHVNTGSERSNGHEMVEQSGLLQEMLDTLHPTYTFLSDVDIERGISEFAERNELDLLVVIPKKHTLLEKIFHKSRSKELALHTHIPLMSIHER